MTDTHEKFTPVAFRIVSDIPRKFGEDNRPFAVNVIARALSQAHQDGIREGKRQAERYREAIISAHNILRADDRYGALAHLPAGGVECEAMVEEAVRVLAATIPDEAE